jgi:methanogenic corrinoid protein MtbC1
MSTVNLSKRRILDSLPVRVRGVMVFVGGAPVTEKWTTEIKEDACGYDADHALKVALRLMEEARVDA